MTLSIHVVSFIYSIFTSTWDVNQHHKISKACKAALQNLAFGIASLYCSCQSVCNTCKSLHIVIGGYMQGPRLSNYNNNSAKSPMSGNMSQDVKQKPRKYKKITDPDGLGSEAWLNFQLDVNAIMACLPW